MMTYISPKCIKINFQEGSGKTNELKDISDLDKSYWMRNFGQDQADLGD